MKINPVEKKQIKVILLGLLTALMVACQSPSSKEKADKTIDQEVKAKAQILNKQCPIQIDNATKLDSCAGLPGKVIQYYFMAYGSTISPEMKAQLVTNCLKRVEKDNSLSDMRKKEVIFKYCYKDYQGLELCSFQIKPEDYDPNYFKNKQKK